MSVIVCYGDSNTHGTKPMHVAGVSDRHARADRWPEAMGALLGAGYEVLSEGLPGRTTVHDDPIEGGVRNGVAVLPAVLHSHKPIDLLVLMLGTNDLKTRFSVSAYEIARSVLRLVQVAQADGIVGDIIAVAPAPVTEAGSLRDVFAGALTRQTGLDDHLALMMRDAGCGFVKAGDHVTVSPVDGVHWEADQHRAFAAVMADVVRARLA